LIAGRRSEASDFPGRSAIKFPLKSVDWSLLLGRRAVPRALEIRTKFEKFWRAIARLMERNRETAEAEFMRLSRNC
jgi:hypothetical protein